MLAEALLAAVPILVVGALLFGTNEALLIRLFPLLLVWRLERAPVLASFSAVLE